MHLIALRLRLSLYVQLLLCIYGIYFFLHLISFYFHLHLHTDEVIYETGLCNTCICILSHIYEMKNSKIVKGKKWQSEGSVSRSEIRKIL